MQLRMAAVLAWPLLAGACTSLGEQGVAPRVPVTRRSTPRDQYEQRLASGRSNPQFESWKNAGRRALRGRLVIRPSFRELVLFDAATATAVGYHLSLRRGQRVTVEYRAISGSSSRLFADVFEEINAPSEMFLHVYSANPEAIRFEFDAGSDGEYVLRLQPPVGEDGMREVIVTATAALTFPVQEGSLRSVGSWFGDERDGGNRHHEGIDIFAARNTPVLAVAQGVITNVEANSIGGRVVWQRDELHNVTYYYAHLQTQLVSVGQRVRAGDRVGTVGNSGNATKARPHLHFAVYRPGQIAVDPVPFLYNQPGDAVAAVTADVTVLGSWSRIDSEGVKLRRTPSPNGATISELPYDARVRLIGGVRDWYRVALEDGTTGFLGAWEIERR